MAACDTVHRNIFLDGQMAVLGLTDAFRKFVYEQDTPQQAFDELTMHLRVMVANTSLRNTSMFLP